MSQEIHALTKSFDLTSVESEIFEHLVEHGSIKAVDLRKVLHLDRAPFYRALSTLEFKNLLTITGDLRKQIIHLQDFKSIREILENKQTQVMDAQKSLDSLKANMRELRDSRYRNNNVEIISGPDAYLQSMLVLLRGGGKILRDITPDSKTLYQMAGSKRKYEEIVSVIKAERLKKKIAIRILFDNQAMVIDDLSMTNPSTLKETRIYDQNLKLDCYLNTCGARTLFFTKDAEGSWGILINDPLITGLLNSLFDVVWKNSKVLGDNHE